MILSVILTVIGTIGMVTACIHAYLGDKVTAHHNTMEALGFWILATLVVR